MLGSILVGHGAACGAGDLDDCAVSRNSDSCPSGVDITIEWDYIECDDDCHHIEVWAKDPQPTSCAGGTYSYLSGIGDVSCDNDPAGCTPGVGFDGCAVDGNVGYEYDAGEPTAFFCYKVELRRDVGDALDDSVECFTSFPALDCFA